MTQLCKLPLDALKSRLAAHTAGRRPHLPFVLVSHVPWTETEPDDSLYAALCEHHENNAPWEGAGRHLLIDSQGTFWIDPDSAWLPAIGVRGPDSEPTPAMIDMAVDPGQSRLGLRNQLQSVAAALLAISDAFELDEVPSVRWQSIRLRPESSMPDSNALPTALCGGI